MPCSSPGARTWTRRGMERPHHRRSATWTGSATSSSWRSSPPRASEACRSSASAAGSSSSTWRWAARSGSTFRASGHRRPSMTAATRAACAHTASRIEAGSRAAAVLGRTAMDVNSFHHQGIRDLAPPLRASGWAGGWTDRGGGRGERRAVAARGAVAPGRDVRRCGGAGARPVPRARRGGGAGLLKQVAAELALDPEGAHADREEDPVAHGVEGAPHRGESPGGEPQDRLEARTIPRARDRTRVHSRGCRGTRSR